MRAMVMAVVLAGVAGAAMAQDAAVEPSGTDPVSVAVDRVRADFNARLVDYDQRIKSLEARLDALEAAEAAPAPAPAPAAN